jgi:hypothetical protein
VDSLREEFKDKLPSLLANMALALLFGALGFFSSFLLDNMMEGLGYFSWLVFILVAGVFLIRALSNVLIIADKAIGIFITQLGIKEQWSRDRVVKDLVVIIIIILALAAIIPILTISINIGTGLIAAITIVTVGVIFVFIYDIGRTSWRILQAKANTVADRFGNNSKGDEK